MLVSARNWGTDVPIVAPVHAAGRPTHITSNTLTTAATNARANKAFMAVPSFTVLLRLTPRLRKGKERAKWP
jgi:hypothetical protein